MIQHIVLFQLKTFDSESAKQSKMSEIKVALEALPELIPQLKLLQVGLNVNPNEAFDISLLTHFESMEDLHTYAVHPEHVAVGKIIREVLAGRACVDAVI